MNALPRSWKVLLALLLLLGGLPLRARVVDNFDDNLKSDWSDFTFVPGFGLPQEVEGQFQFRLPPAGQALFTASQKKSETFELKEGRTIEFRTDLVKGGAKDSFAVMGFVPKSVSPGTLQGYTIAKSTTDILIIKGINKYFYAENPATPLKNENVTMVLRLTVKGGNVILNARILDKDANDAVIFEKTVIDTPEADVFADGKDEPAAPFITEGYFTLFCYADFDRNAPEDPYQVTYDNVEAWVSDVEVVDDFNDNTKTDWSDFTFVPGFGLPKEENGQFQFRLPPAGQALFTASQKLSRAVDLLEGDRVELSVDLVEGGGKDSFAILGFVPKGVSPGTLAGYSVAKSATDILIVKGINKYFYNENPEPAIKNENVTIKLTMTVRGGAVTINVQVLDKDNNNAVLFDKTVVDTAAADVFADGKDEPATPFIGSGYVTLFCYADFDRNAPEDPYKVTFDNLMLSAPPSVANKAPIISETKPDPFANFVAASAQVSFKVADDKALPADKISLTLNGTRYTTANGLTLSGTDTARTASMGGLVANVNYTAVIDVEDADGAKVTQTHYFDTFQDTNFVIEVEDYNFGGGQFIDNPVPVAEGSGPRSDAYSMQAGVVDVDFTDTRGTPNSRDTMYRVDDPIRMQHTLDNARRKFTAAGGTDSGVFDYDVGDFAAGEWMNYTRTFPAGVYEVYLRQSVVNMETGETVLEEVTGDRTQANATVRPLGSFLGAKTGFQYRNFALTDGTGRNKALVRLTGTRTLRLRQITANSPDGGRLQNYLIFIPVEGAPVQRANVTALAPANGAVVETVTPSLSAEIQNRDTTVNISTIRLEVNGAAVTPRVTSNANGAAVAYDFSSLPASGVANQVKLSFKDNEGVDVVSEWSFAVSYRSLNGAYRQAGTGRDRGFLVRMVQAPAGSQLENNLIRAEDQLAPNSAIPKFVETNFVETAVVDYNKRVEDRGFFAPDTLLPGIDGDANGTDDFTVEVLTYLDLPAGVHRFGVTTDDGYKLVAGRDFKDLQTAALAFHSGGPANETFDFVVPVAGLYPFRFVWYERAGAGYAEWFSVNMATGDRTLINDPATPSAVKAYRTVQAPALILEAAASVNGPWGPSESAVLDATGGTFRVTPRGPSQFFRLRSNSGGTPTIRSFEFKDGALTLRFGL